MKRNTTLLSALLLLLITTAAFAQQEVNAEKWTTKQASRWFAKVNWYQKTKLQPDPSINKKEFASRYFKNKDLWDKAFAFLRDSDLTKLTLGVHELQGKDLFVKVTDYKTREPDYAPFETHTKYSDIHTVVSGVEYIQLSSREGSAVKTPYNNDKDIEFYTVAKSTNLLSKPGKFFLIFPDDLHKQGVKIDTSLIIRKIVIKVKN
jgi:biofilm protein TabA